MNKYEAMYIVTPEMEDEAIKGVIEKFSGIITANGGAKSWLTPSIIRPRAIMCW